MPEVLETVVTPSQLGKALGVKKSTILKWAIAGKIPAVRISSKVVRFRPHEVWAAIETAQGPGDDDR